MLDLCWSDGISTMTGIPNTFNAFFTQLIISSHTYFYMSLELLSVEASQLKIK